MEHARDQSLAGASLAVEDHRRAIGITDPIKG